MANEVVINVNADVAKAKAGLAGIADKMKAVGRSATIAGGIITGLGVASVTQFAKMGDEVQKMALRTGFSTEALSELRVAADLSGSSLKGMETGIRRMSKVIVDAKDGLAESKDALDRMGVSVDDLMGKRPEEQFEILTMALADMSDKTEQVATAQEVFGRAGTALLPMLAGGAEGLEAMKQKAHEMGVVFDQEAADKAARLSDSLTTLKGSFQGVMLAIAEQLAPVVTDVAEKMGTAISKISAWTKSNPGLTKVIVLVSAAVGGLLLVLGPLLMMLPGLIAIAPMVGLAFHAMLGPFGLITLAITGLIALVAGLVIAWKRDFGGIRDITAKILQTLLDGFISFMRQFAKPMDFLIDTFNQLMGKSIPNLSEALDQLDNVVINFGEVVDETMGRSRLEVDAVTKSVKDMDNALATIGNDTLPNILIPQVEKLGQGVTAAVQIAPTATGQTAPTGYGGGGRGGGGIPDDPLGIKAAYFAAGFTVGKGNRPDPEPQGIPAGMMGQGYFSMGLEAQMRGEDPARVVQVAINGKNIDEAGGDEEAYSAEFPTGGEA